MIAGKRSTTRTSGTSYPFHLDPNENLVGRLLDRIYLPANPIHIDPILNSDYRLRVEADDMGSGFHNTIPKFLSTAAQRPLIGPNGFIARNPFSNLRAGFHFHILIHDGGHT